MDSIDKCRIECKFVENKDKREFLAERLNNLTRYLERICRALNDVCKNSATVSCYQCFDEVNKAYNTAVCEDSCKGKSRLSFCFLLSEGLILNVIAEDEGGCRTIITFYPINRDRERTIEKKCDKIFNQV
ncbi:hypothetical protein AB1303_13535 [Saccharolobus solfataricus]|nr:hypothetical protein [Saccharolobus solfataricus]